MDDASHLDADDPLERARAFVEASGAEPLSLDALAAVAGLSAYHFARQFTARFGVSPVAYVREQRMALAASRLAEQSPRPWSSSPSTSGSKPRKASPAPSSAPMASARAATVATPQPRRSPP